MSEYDASLSIELRQQIWDLWQERITIKSLAAAYQLTEEEIRDIISKPRPR